jgi:hypothetical protein
MVTFQLIKTLALLSGQKRHASLFSDADWSIVKAIRSSTEQEVIDF